MIISGGELGVSHGIITMKNLLIQMVRETGGEFKSARLLHRFLNKFKQLSLLFCSKSRGVLGVEINFSAPLSFLSIETFLITWRVGQENNLTGS